jgi:cob(I)alamin adenosyltransferase
MDTTQKLIEIEQSIYALNKDLANSKADHVKNVKRLEQFIDSYQLEHGFDCLYEELRTYINLLKEKHKID